ncbi:MAG TPA: STAS domain-containing protein [Candidatus Melainabacteria bacterium]|nr:STAS domain-containing protein [Candidatus Melainabacteria bacterium]HIN64577.1 STAS domain-containing protein [Candidatus Obscuribacterales bacterium]
MVLKFGADAQTLDETPFEGTDVTHSEIEKRREFLTIDESDAKRLGEIREFAHENVEGIVEEFYSHLLSFPQTAAFFRDPKVLARVKQAQTRYFLDLVGGSYGDDYVRNRLKIGRLHQNIDLGFDVYLGAYRRYLDSFLRRLLAAFTHDTEKAIEGYLSMLKLVFLDISLAADTYLRTIRLQTEAIKELATPVLQVRDGLLISPIIGMVDTQRARQLTESILWAIREKRAKVVVIDITGVPLVDSKVANHLVQTVEAARLMGAVAIVTGISPEIAQTLVVLGVNLSSVKTVADLQTGIEEAEFYLSNRPSNNHDHEMQGN